MNEHVDQCVGMQGGGKKQKQGSYGERLEGLIGTKRQAVSTRANQTTLEVAAAIRNVLEESNSPCCSCFARSNTRCRPFLGGATTSLPNPMAVQPFEPFCFAWPCPFD